jgi:acetyl-CoA acetyltransferase
MLLHYVRGVVQTRNFKNAQSKSWNIRYNRTLLYNQGLSMEHYMEQCGTKRHLVGKFVLDKHNLFCYAGDQHKPKGYGVVTMTVLSRAKGFRF